MANETTPASLDLGTMCSATLAARFWDVFALAQAGIVLPDASLRSFFAEISGTKFRIRNWSRLSGRAAADDGTENTSYKEMTSEGEEAVVVRRRINLRVFEAAINAGGPSANVNQAIADQTPAVWARENQATIWDILKALFDTSSGILLSTHAHNIAKTSGTAQRATRAGIRAAKAKLGDAASTLTVACAHSAVIEDLKAEHYTTSPNVPFPMNDFEGLRLIADDSIEPISGNAPFAIYPTYIMRPGAIGLMMQKDMTANASFNAGYNAWDVVQALALVPHIFGVSWTGQAAWVKPDWTPSTAELQNAGNWAKRTGTEARDFGVVALLSNKSA